MGKLKGLHRICNNLIPSAMFVLQKEYTNPKRVKLTHFWLAQQLGVPNLIAFHLLEKIASKKLLCVQFPAGPIFWDNELINVNVAMSLCITTK